ncbi:unknown [Ruminococcus sp. CAG:624]|nr:unknown [Ruminococcus sp. CAG:624]
MQVHMNDIQQCHLFVLQVPLIVVAAIQHLTHLPTTRQSDHQYNLKVQQSENQIDLFGFQRNTSAHRQEVCLTAYIFCITPYNAEALHRYNLCHPSIQTIQDRVSLIFGNRKQHSYLHAAIVLPFSVDRYVRQKYHKKDNPIVAHNSVFCLENQNTHYLFSISWQR